MKKYYVESIIGKIADGIQKLIERGAINSKKEIYLFGMDTFSMGMKTILSNKGYRINSYLLDDEIRVMNENRRIKAFRARYCNGSVTEDYILIRQLKAKEFEKKDFVILVVAKNYTEVREKLSAYGYLEGEDFYKVFDWNDDSFADEMRGKEQLSITNVQSRLKDMLRNIDEYCMKHNIQYWVCGGTLLGTIRHKGFIPWDDDVDIFMPMPDYKKFIKSFCTDGMYQLLGPEITDRVLYSELFLKIIDNDSIVREDNRIVRKIHPLAIDVFPLIGVPAVEQERLKFFAGYYELEKSIWEDYYKQNGNMDVYNKWYVYQKEYLEKYEYSQSEYVGVIATAYKEKDCVAKEVYSRTLRMPFEDIEVNVPVGYKEYLARLYGGNWGEIPSKEKRKSHHNMTAFLLD